MLRELLLLPDEVKRLQVEGQWLIITQATGPIEITIGGTSPIIVDEKDRVHLRNMSPNDRSIRVRNISGATNLVELHTSDLLVDKQTAVNIKDAIFIAPDQQVGIDPNSNIVQAVVQNAVCIDEQCNTVKLQQDNITYYPLPTVVFSAAVGGDNEEIVTDKAVIDANSQRQQLILTANPSNQQPVWLGGEKNTGTPLLPGEKLTLATHEALTLLGQIDDWVYVAELAA